jgi:hypothetical protein
VLTKNIQDIY